MVERISDDNSVTNEAMPSPGRAFLSGIVAGILILFLGTLLPRILGQQQLVSLEWLLPMLGAAVAASAAAYKMGSSLGRVISLAVLALSCALFIRGVLDYIALFEVTVGPVESTYRRHTDIQQIFWRWQLVTSFLAITVGGLIGLMFRNRK